MQDLPPLEQRFTEVLQSTIQQWPVDPDDRDEVSSRVTELGGIQVVKSAIHHPDDSNEFLSLHASDRPDLTLEALALSPAWNNLFGEEDKAAARTRLTEARTRWENRQERQARTFSDTWVFWIDGWPVGVSHHGVEDSESPFPTCQMFARMSETFAESGQFGASFDQRRHYRNCDACSTLDSLDQVVALSDQEGFRRLRLLLSMVPVLLDKPQLALVAVPPLWVLLPFIDLKFDDINPGDWVAARQGFADKAFSGFVQSLSLREFFGLPLAKRMALVFEPAIAYATELLLPAELGFPSQPGVVNTSISADEWNRLVAMQDDKLWSLKQGNGLFDDYRFDWFHFEQLVIEATSFQILHWWKGSGAEYLLPPDLQPISQEPPGTPKDDQTPIDFAETSLRQALGDETCNNLYPDAFMDAAAAERLNLDRGQRQGQGIIFHLVRAFEHQLLRVVVQPFAESLRLAGAREFPPPISKPLAWELGLGDVEELIQHSRDLAVFFKVKRLDRRALADALAEVRSVRNKAFHGRSYTPDEGREFRDHWFGIARSDGGIFGLLRPQVR